jgi:hypothetical protein
MDDHLACSDQQIEDVGQLAVEESTRFTRMKWS